MFPRQAREFLARSVLLKDAPARIDTELRARYRRVLQVATLHAGGRRLVLKNPPNTARIRMLLEMFPDASFITLLTLDMLHSAETMLELYEGMMQRLLDERRRRPGARPGGRDASAL